MRSAFTFVEIIVCMAILLVLLAIIVPVTMISRERGRSATCISNLRQLHAAYSLYASDNDGAFPPYQNRLNARYGIEGVEVTAPEQGDLLVRALHPYVTATSLWFCPNDIFAGTSATDGFIRHQYSSYRTGNFVGLASFTNKPDTNTGPGLIVAPNAVTSLLLSDDLNGAYSQVRPPYSHSGRYNGLFFDGHVSSFDRHVIP